MTKAKSAPTEPVLGELQTIKRLLVFALIRDGASQTDVAAALGIDRSQVSRMFPDGTAKIAKGGS